MLLAHAPTDLVERVIAAGLPRQARAPSPGPTCCGGRWPTSDRTGYCLSRDEMTDGASSVAAPVRCATGEVIAAISVVVPSGQRDLHSLVPVTRMAAAGISRGMRPHAASP